MNETTPTTRHECVSEMETISKAIDEILSLSPDDPSLQAIAAPLQARHDRLSVLLHTHLSY